MQERETHGNLGSESESMASNDVTADALQAADNHGEIETVGEVNSTGMPSNSETLSSLIDETELGYKETNDENIAHPASVSPIGVLERGTGSHGASTNELGRRGVYKMPEEIRDTGDNMLFLPAGLIIQAVVLQVKLIVYAFSAIIWLLMFFSHLLVDPARQISEIKRVAWVLAEKLSIFVDMRDRAAYIGPKLWVAARKLGWGFLGVIYVGLALSTLLVPAYWFDLILVNRFVQEPINIRESLYFDYTQARPSAYIPLVRSQSIAPQKITNANLTLKIHATVQLTLPDSDYNQRLGMFQVTGELISNAGDILARSSQPCMLRYQSAPIRYIKTLIWALSILVDLSGEYQKLNLDIMDYKGESSSLGHLKVLVEPRAGFSPGSGLPEIYSAEIYVESQLPWMYSMLYRWKWTIYIWSGLALFILEVCLVLCCCRHVLLPKGRRRRIPPSQAKVCSSDRSSVTASKDYRKRPGQGKKRVCFQDEVTIHNATSGDTKSDECSSSVR